VRIVIDVRPEQPLNASVPIDVTVYTTPSIEIVSGIVAVIISSLLHLIKVALLVVVVSPVASSVVVIGLGKYVKSASPTSKL
jgi:type III secretory pathway component EscU